MNFGGAPGDIESILGTLNPIEMYERKIDNMMKAGGIQNSEETIRLYTALIEHYSLRNKEKM